jgi:hypothetical protein
MAAGLFAAGLIIAALAPPGLVSVPRSLPFVIAMALLAPDLGHGPAAVVTARMGSPLP